jgi:hypothetical protein
MSVRVITAIDAVRGVLYELVRADNLWSVVRIDTWKKVKDWPNQGEVLARNLSLELAVRYMYQIAQRLGVVCDGCECLLDRCGPALWDQQKKCCPDCTHVVSTDVEQELSLRSFVGMRLCEVSGCTNEAIGFLDGTSPKLFTCLVCYASGKCFRPQG